MAQRSTATRRTTLMSDGTVEFLRRRAANAAGLALLIFALALALALASYDPGDPSWAHATDRVPGNWIGLPGAFAADLVLQTIGLAGIACVLALTAWAWRVMSLRGFAWGWLHVALLPIALTLTATWAATLSPASGWPLHVGLGGVIGDFLLTGLVDVFQTLGIDLGAATIGSALLAAAAAAMLATVGITWREWLGAGNWVVGWLIRAVHGVRFLADVGAGPAGYDPDRPVAVERRAPRLTEPATKRRRPAERVEPEPEAPTTPSRRTRVQRRNQKPKASGRAAKDRQHSLDLGLDGEFQPPPLHLLAMPREDELKPQVDDDGLEQNARILESVLEDFGVRGEIVTVRPGPVVTLYELEPAPGTKSSRVIGLADDIARSMSAISARVAVIPGRNAIGIELPNLRRETVYLRELLSSSEFERAKSGLTIALGKQISGAPVFADLARMPHLLIAGTTGSGKSVAINTMILSLLYRMTPDACRFIMIDPKMLELSVYDGIPHLLCPVVTDPSKAVVALKWTVKEMERRYRKMSELGVRNITGYNKRLEEARTAGEQLRRTVQTGFDDETGEPIFEDMPLDLDPLPLIVVIVDEMADLMLVAGKDIEAAIQRLAQMARAAGIHLIMATQRPSVDVITGTIKANFPTRISFQVTSKIDSRTILGEQGAEQLLGMGDMLYMPSAGRLTRVHGPFVSDGEVENVVLALKRQGKPDYLDEVTDADEVEGGDFTLLGGSNTSSGGSEDPLYDQAVALVCRERKASTSFVQRHLQIGYNRAARIVERMEAEGVISPANRVGKREVLARDIDDMTS